MESLHKNRENKQKNREIDRVLGEQYRTDQRAIGLTYTEYKKQWQESIKLKELKTHYSVFEPTPGESPYDFGVLAFYDAGRIYDKNSDSK